MRNRINMDSGWRFFLGDLPPRSDVAGWGGAKAKPFSFGAAAKGFDDSGWKELSLPHDFVLTGDYTRKREHFLGEKNIPAMESMDNRHVTGGSLEGGVGWYRHRFTLPQDYREKRVYLYFDGVYRDCLVFVNEFDVGRHSGGYTSFFFDVTDFLDFEKENLLAVRVDATGREGWWYEGGGIYRKVYMEAVSPVHIAPWGSYVAAKPEKEGGSYVRAEIRIQTQLKSRAEETKSHRLESLVLDAKGEVAVSVSSEGMLEAWEEKTETQSMILNKPALWDTESPYLYRLCTRVYDGEQLIDSVENFFGIRDIHFDPDKGFFLNGGSVKLKGLCCHQDHAGLGIAVPEGIWEYRLRRMKEMGANAYRCAHNPPSRELLDCCDRLGILVMDENRKLNSSEEVLGHLRSMVKRDRNHPSIVLWSIGNEEFAIQDKAEGGRLARTAQMEVKKLDATRPVTMAFCGWNGEFFHDPKVFLPASQGLDIMGFNYMPEGWKEYHEVMPHQPIVVTEAAANSGTRGCYKTDAVKSQYFVLDPNNEGLYFKKDVAECQWKQTAELDYIGGLFLWTGFDYRGEPSPFSYPAVSSQFGVMDSCGFAKDNFYYYKSWWSDDTVLHLFPHWNRPDQIGQPVTVYCYSNADEVELFVNGESQGRKQMKKNWYLEWTQVVYQPGSLSAIGYINGAEAVRDEVQTTLGPARLAIVPDKQEAAADGKDVLVYTIKVLDEEGRLVPHADPLIRFEIKGGGRLLGVGNGNPGSHEPDKIPMRRAFHGLCQLIVQTEPFPGDIEVTAAADGLRSARSVVKSVLP